MCACLIFLPAFAAVDAARDQMPAGLWKSRAGELRLQILPKNRIRLFADQNTTAFEVQFEAEATVRREYWFAVDSIKSVEHKIRAPKKPEAEKKDTQARSPAPAPAEKPAKQPLKDIGKESAGPGAPQTNTAANAKETNKTQESKQPAKKQPAAKTPPANKGPLRLGWLTKDSKIILSFLTEYPPPAPNQTKQKAKKKAMPATKAAVAADSKIAAADSAKDSKDTPPANRKLTNAGPKNAQQSVAESPAPKTPAQNQKRKKQPAKPRGPMPIVELLVFQNGQLVHEAIFERGR